MGTRAEEIARSTRTLAFDRRLTPEEGLRALSGELDQFATEMLATAERVQQDSLLGRAVAEALGGHAADLAALAQQREGAEDPAAIRTRLRLLVVTLDALPTRMKASRERTAEVGPLAARVQEAAGRASVLVVGSGSGRQDQRLALSREFGRLAEDAASVSAQFSADAAMAVRVAEDMAGQAANLPSGRWAGGSAVAGAQRRASDGAGGRGGGGRQPFLDRADEPEARPRAVLNRVRDAAGRRAGCRHPETRQP